MAHAVIGNIGIMENTMETNTIIGVMGNIGIIENKMETNATSNAKRDLFLNPAHNPPLRSLRV